MILFMLEATYLQLVPTSLSNKQLLLNTCMLCVLGLVTMKICSLFFILPVVGPRRNLELFIVPLSSQLGFSCLFD